MMYAALGIFPKDSRMRGWSGGMMVLGKLPVLGCPTNLDKSRARAHCSGYGWGLFGHFYSHLSFLFLAGPRSAISRAPDS